MPVNFARSQQRGRHLLRMEAFQRPRRRATAALEGIASTGMEKGAAWATEVVVHIDMHPGIGTASD